MAFDLKRLNLDGVGEKKRGFNGISEYRKMRSPKRKIRSVKCKIYCTADFGFRI
jgi:hypothetical protein